MKPGKFNLPDECLRYLLWQRAAYRYPFLTQIMKMSAGFRLGRPVKNLYMKHIAGSWIERNRRETIAKLYFADLDKIAAVMQPHLPVSCECILDIGCGLAGIDAILFSEYLAKGRQTELWLLDKDDQSPLDGRHYTGFRDVAAAYNALDVTKVFLTVNGVPPESLHLIDISKDIFPSHKKFNVVVSLLSWGFHFPVETYAEHVRQSMTFDGVLFIDIRKHTDGIEKLGAAFRDISIIAEGDKNLFVAAREPRE